MKGLEEIGVTGEGLQRGRLRPPEERGEVVVLHRQSGQWAPCQRIFQVAPDPGHRVQLWAIGRQAYMVQAGAVPMRWSLVPLEFQREWARKETDDAVIDIVKQHAEAHGVGAEAYSMQQYTIAPNAAVGFPLSGKA